jgi:hypothetical protein
MRLLPVSVPHFGQNEAPIGSGEVQKAHFSTLSVWYPMPSVVRSIRITMINMNPRTIKLVIGLELLRKKKGKMKNVLFSNPPLPIINRITPLMMHRIPIQRKF